MAPQGCAEQQLAAAAGGAPGRGHHPTMPQRKGLRQGGTREHTGNPTYGRSATCPPGAYLCFQLTGDAQGQGLVQLARLDAHRTRSTATWGRASNNASKHVNPCRSRVHMARAQREYAPRNSCGPMRQVQEADPVARGQFRWGEWQASGAGGGAGEGAGGLTHSAGVGQDVALLLRGVEDVAVLHTGRGSGAGGPGGRGGRCPSTRLSRTMLDSSLRSS